MMRDATDATISIVVVDDHPVVRDGIRGMLEREPGMSVIGEAADGAEALTTIARLHPDVVLMDLRMPELDGVGAIRVLRAENPDAPRILVLTTYDTDTDIRAAVDAAPTDTFSRRRRVPISSPRYAAPQPVRASSTRVLRQV